ncbi:integrase core domain-containing protein [Chromobacterium vaccinii]|uniref:integrase core domain-containing protein n=1 Tax=Chromobacterium vaccinii TaxID=1108595 RepID=UPI0011AB312D|nr:integrase core domain-containing protein [Chromobacterium vaccinii]
MSFGVGSNGGAVFAYRCICRKPGISSRPMRKSYVESLNARFREDCLNEHVFDCLAEARQVMAAWHDDYNQVLFLGSICRIPPVVCAVHYRQEKAATLQINPFHNRADQRLLSRLRIWLAGADQNASRY